VIRAVAALALMSALAACGIIGPPQSDIERAVTTYYADGVPRADVPDLRGAAIADFEGCQPLRGFYRCPVIFQTASGRVPTLIWLQHGAHGWRVQNIALNAPRR
jgi:predicted small lipoprotein YifL